MATYEFAQLYYSRQGRSPWKLESHPGLTEADEATLGDTDVTAAPVTTPTTHLNRLGARGWLVFQSDTEHFANSWDGRTYLLRRSSDDRPDDEVRPGGEAAAPAS